MIVQCLRALIVLLENQHPHGSSQLSVTPIPGDPMSSSGLWAQGMHMVYRHTSEKNIHT